MRRCTGGVYMCVSGRTVAYNEHLTNTTTVRDVSDESY
jgi:hypothetical protein